MIRIQKELLVFENDINDVLHIFSKYIKVEELELDIQANKIDRQQVETMVKSTNNCLSKMIQLTSDDLVNKRLIKRSIKFLLYQLLSSICQVKMPWGSLTGVRPSKLVYDKIEEGCRIEDIPKCLVEDFGVSKEKADLICDVVKNQLRIKIGEKQIDLYINIPICPTRCVYCSFISSEYSRCKQYIDKYVECLVKELKEIVNYLIGKGYAFKNIYMGGGTPTTLNCQQLEKILKCIDFKFNEFTVECGRPDTISIEKLDLLKSYGVTRISINPQSLNDKTLEIIGRSHTSNDFLEKYQIAKKYPFQINTDIIAGLPKESFDDFKYTLDNLIKLSPNNITVHTLAVKNASILKQKISNLTEDEIQKMVEYSYKILTNNNYKPYYLYRQKNMLGLYENVGYFKDNAICEFNIESMEEMVSIVACGAGAISKRIFKEQNRIERTANVKQIQDYIARIDEMIERKSQLFK